MANLSDKLNAFLAEQPWWMLAVVIAVMVFRRTRRSRSAPNAESERRRTGKEKTAPLFDTRRPVERKDPAPALDDDERAQLNALLKSGKKIEAIKFIRERRDLSLLEAKNLVEALERSA